MGYNPRASYAFNSQGLAFSQDVFRTISQRLAVQFHKDSGCLNSITMNSAYNALGYEAKISFMNGEAIVNGQDKSSANFFLQNLLKGMRAMASKHSVSSNSEAVIADLNEVAYHAMVAHLRIPLTRQPNSSRPTPRLGND